MRTVLRTLATLCLPLLLAVPAFSQTTIYRGMNVATDIDATDIIDLNTLLNPNVARYAISFGSDANTMTVSEYMARLDTALTTIDNDLLPAFAASGIKVVLGVGTPPGGFSNLLPPLPQMRIFSDVTYENALKDVWRLLAARYKDNTTIVAFQLLSEPAIGSAPGAGVSNWRTQQNALAAIVREYDTTHPIVVTSPYSNPAKVRSIRVDSNLGPFWYAMHVYVPTKFLQQGAETPALSANYPSRTVGTRSTLVRYLRSSIAFHQRLLRAGGRDKIFVSEFTTTRFGPPRSEIRYLRDIVNIFNQHAWNWTYHAWREADTWSVELPAPDETLGVTTRRAAKLQTYFAQVNGS